MHLTSHSGYDITFNNVDQHKYASVYYSYRFLKFQKVINKVLSILFPKYFGMHYRFEQFLLELRIAWAIKKYKPKVVHITHVQDDLRIITKKIFSKGVTLIGTVHIPHVMWKTGRRKMEWLNMYDRIMVLDHYSKNAFEKHFPGKIIFAPHGVDTEYFKLTKSFSTHSKKETFNCFFVGRFLRDLEMVFDIIKLLYQRDKTIHFHFSHPMILAPQQFYYKMIGVMSLSTVHYYSKVNDATLLKFYQEHDLLVMPMFESTANNVFLEAAACGMPVLSTPTNGLPSYMPPSLEDTLGNLNSAEDIVALILQFRNDPAYYNDVAKTLYDYTIENFNLEKSKEVPFQLYEEYL